MLRKLLPDHPGLWQGELRCLRYRPERRYVAELHAADQTRALLKSYTRKGYFRGKRALLSVTTGGPEATFQYNGRNGDIEHLLWPMQFSLYWDAEGRLKPGVAGYSPFMRTER